MKLKIEFTRLDDQEGLTELQYLVIDFLETSFVIVGDHKTKNYNCMLNKFYTWM